MNFIYLVFVIFFISTAAPKTEETATNDTDITFLITGGYRPPTHTLTKYAVSVRTRFYDEFFGDNHYCGGSIIGLRIILTAAHCITSREGDKIATHSVRDLRVVARTTNRLVQTNDTLVMDVRNIRIHPLYDPASLKADIAILKLEDDIKIDGTLAEIIPLPNGPVEPGTNCTVVGWGRIFENGPLAANAMYVDINILQDNKCKKYDVFSDGMLCVASLDDRELDSCQGDSGGPLICEQRVVGIVSFGKGCASGTPGVYTNVWHYREWVIENRSCLQASNIPLIIIFTLILIAYY